MHTIASILTQGISAFKESFEERFAEAFPLPVSFNQSYSSFSQDITANLFGGVGYFYGDSLTDHAFIQEWDRDEDEDGEPLHKQMPTLTPPRELLTATPSRSFFPRGFYWCAYGRCGCRALTLSCTTGTKDFTCCTLENGIMT